MSWSLAACSGDLSMLDPKGPAAARVVELWWLLLTLSSLILVGVVGVALYALKRNRRKPTFSDRKVLVGWGLVFPLTTLLALMAFVFLRGEQLLARPPETELVIDVHARQWNWAVTHPGGEQTANVIHVPAGENFRVKVFSQDVIHSFWVPSLGGKIDAVPGKENSITLRAERPGIYLGVCAEYCGIGHARMQIEVHAHRQRDYEAALSGAATADRLPVHTPRAAPAAAVISAWIDYLLEWIGAE